MAKKKDGPGPVHATKRCPECFEYVPLFAKKCPACNTRLGPVQPHGLAKRETDWLSYLVAIIAIIGFSFYIWWAFLR